MSDAAHILPGSERPTPARQWSVGLLIAGGVLSALNGAAHFVLPVMYGWDQHADGLYEPVRWALYATTVFFAVLLVFAGVLTVLVARAADIPTRVVGWVAGGMAVFWTLAAAYELIVPFPASGADWALPVFSAITALLYLAGGWLRQRALRQSASGRTREGIPAQAAAR